MANKAVLGVATVLTAGFAANELYKDYKCKQEEKAERQHLEDILEQRQQAEEERRERNACKQQQEENSTRQKQEDGDPGGRMFLWNSRLQSEIILLELLKTIREKAVSEFGERHGYLRGIHLPLLNKPGASESNSVDEIVFAAAVALGDDSVIEAAIEEGIFERTPEMILVKLEKQSIDFINKEFQAFFQNRKAFGCESSVPLSNMPMDWIRYAFLGTVLSSGEAKVWPVCTPSSSRLCKSIVPELRLWEKILGFHAISLSQFERKGLLKSNIVRYSLKNKKKKLLIAKGEFFLLNFFGGFSVPCEQQKLGRDSRLVKVHMKFHEATSQNPIVVVTEKHRSSAEQLMGGLQAIRIAEEASSRLAAFKGGAFLEHIAAWSGVDTSMLEVARTSYIQMLEKNESIMKQKLSKSLKQCIPPNSYEKNASVAQTILEAEISAFVDRYVRLLNLSYCIVPFLNGRPPSTFVPELCVRDQAMEVVGMTHTPPRSVERNKRLLESNEREREIRSRKLAECKLPTTVTALGVLFLLASFYWLSIRALSGKFEFLSKSLRSPPYFEGAALRGSSALLALWALSTISNLAQIFLMTTEKNSETYLKQKWRTAVVVGVWLRRWWIIKITRDTPFQCEVAQLTRSCLRQYNYWKIKCATEDFYESLHRGRITFGDLNSILVALLEESVDDDFLVGQFPGSVEDAEAFLLVEVDDNEDSGPSDQRTIMLSDAAAAMSEEMNEFPIGARVLVSVGRPDELLADGEQQLWSASGIGSVVSSSPGVVVVLLDGVKEPLPLPSELCSIIEEGEPQRNDVNSVKVPHISVGSRVRVNTHGLQGSTWDGANATGVVVETFEGNFLHVQLDGEEDNIAVSSWRCEVVDGGAADDSVRVEDVSAEDEDDKSQHVGEATGFQRAATVEAAIKAGGWGLERRGNHLVFKRPKQTDRKFGRGMETFVMASTPSDRRAVKNALAKLNRMNREYVIPASRAERGTQRCILCKDYKEESAFSATQWKKRDGKKCKDCNR